ncbi:MAG TPA: hypothetical protein VL484_11800, partial [Vicinamibacterales bacterium]|nr:hypothetical protein [Vicinamibacterales bacterium]
GSWTLPEAERELRLREAEQVARAALADLSGDDADTRAGTSLLAVELRHVLFRIYVKQRRNDEALRELESIVDAAERLVAAMPRGELPPALRRMFDRPDGEGRDRRPRDADPDALETLAERIAAKALLERLAAIRAKVRERSGH